MQNLLATNHKLIN